MFKRCVGAILLIAFIRLQLVCCCGSIACCPAPMKTEPMALATGIDSATVSKISPWASAHDSGKMTFSSAHFYPVQCSSTHCCDNHEDTGSSDEVAYDIEIKGPQLDELQISSALRCRHDRDQHRHTLYILKHGLVTSASKLTLNSIVIVHVFPVAMIAYSRDDRLMNPSQRPALIGPFMSLGILDALGQLRI